jgi:hypothetical protein
VWWSMVASPIVWSSCSLCWHVSRPQNGSRKEPVPRMLPHNHCLDQPHPYLTTGPVLLSDLHSYSLHYRPWSLFTVWFSFLQPSSPSHVVY